MSKIEVMSIEELAEELYEESRKRVSGRPPWSHLDPSCPYDMGMRETARTKAREQRERELGLGE
jgi:hypothetical protein